MHTVETVLALTVFWVQPIGANENDWCCFIDCFANNQLHKWHFLWNNLDISKFSANNLELSSIEKSVNTGPRTGWGQDQLHADGYFQGCIFFSYNDFLLTSNKTWYLRWEKIVLFSEGIYPALIGMHILNYCDVPIVPCKWCHSWIKTGRLQLSGMSILAKDYV